MTVVIVTQYELASVDIIDEQDAILIRAVGRNPEHSGCYMADPMIRDVGWDVGTPEEQDRIVSVLTGLGFPVEVMTYDAAPLPPRQQERIE